MSVNTVEVALKTKAAPAKKLKKDMTMTGAQMIVRALEAEGVEHVFGIPGGAVIPLYDAIGDASFTTILTRHEQAACHAADGYARATGKTGVCIATSGPGATNIVTGLANAQLDSVPLVVITGQVATHLIGSDAFQESDIFGCSLPLVKHSFMVRCLEELPKALRGAFFLASSGRPGPVIVDIPVDIQKARGSFGYPEEVSFPHYSARYKSDIRALGEATSALREAKRPVIIAGGGSITSGAGDQIFKIATEESIPVATTLMGKGIFPEDHALSLGMLGMHGTAQANLAVSGADLILAVGTRFSDRTTGSRDHFAPRARVIHIEIDSAEIGKNIRSDISLKGDCSAILSELIKELPKESPPDHQKWLNDIERVRGANPAEPAPGKGLHPYGIIKSLRSRVSEEDILTTEVGQHQMWAALHWKTSTPGTFVTSGGLGTMGFGLPAAIGAAFARPGRPVTCLSGDGSFFMNIQELETCVRYNLPVRLIVLNNGSLGMVRQWQDLFWRKRFIQTCQKPVCSLSKVAESFGLSAWSAENPAQLEEALDGAFAAKGPSFVECFIPIEENVYPMVPAGERLDQFLDPLRQVKTTIRT